MNRSPTVARWELARRLTTRRTKLGLDVKSITDSMGFSRNYWSAVENGRTLVAEDRLESLVALMRFSPTDRAELFALRSAAKERGWWDGYSELLGADFRHFIGLEHGARRMRAYESNLIPGLLQIEDYTRAILQSDPASSPMDIDDLLSVRRRRQNRLRGPGPLEFTALLSEAAVLQQVSGPEVQVRQLRHLLHLIGESQETLRIRIVPFTSNPGVIANSSTLLLLDFDNPHLPQIAWQETLMAAETVESPSDEYRRLDYSWNEGLRGSLNEQESIALLEHAEAKLHGSL